MPKRWEAEFPERDASVLRRKASQQGIPTRDRPFRESKGAIDGAQKRRRAGDARAKGRETHVEPTDVYSCPPQEGGYSAREAPKADPRKKAYSES